MLENSISELMQLSADIAYEHHERYDGTGYDKSNILTPANMFVYNASSNRKNKKKFTEKCTLLFFAYQGILLQREFNGETNMEENRSLKQSGSG